LNKRQSSEQGCSKKILIKTDENGLQLSTQLDIESTIRILEVCLRNMMEKASQNVVPIGKEK